MAVAHNNRDEISEEQIMRWFHAGQLSGIIAYLKGLEDDKAKVIIPILEKIYQILMK